MAQTSVQKPQQLIEEANAAFEAGEFPLAIDLYSQIVAQKQASATLFINLGSAHYHNGSPGKAALWYRRADHLKSDLPEVEHNLDVLKQNLGHHAFNTEPWHDWLSKVPENLIKCIAWACLWIALLIVLALLFSKRVSIKPMLVVFFIFFVTISITTFYLQNYRTNHLDPTNFATVTDAQSKAMVSPAPDSEPIIDLPEGSEVKIIEDTGPWLYVSIPGEHLGWVHHSSVEQNWPIPIADISDNNGDAAE